MIAIVAGFLLAPAPIKGACVGDSITYGYSLPPATRERDSYPGVLGRRLGGGYVVQNFGHTGCTLMNLDWLPPLIKTDEYKKSLAFKPDIVILMGGTNDGAPRNWTHVSQLPADIKKIVQSYETLSSHARVYLMTPPRILTKAEHGVIDDDQCHNVNQLLPPILRAVARDNSLQLIDSRTVVNTRDSYLIDGIHLSEKGCQKLANQVAFVLLKKKTSGK